MGRGMMRIGEPAVSFEFRATRFLYPHQKSVEEGYLESTMVNYIWKGARPRLIERLEKG
jgi:hypothetical protein